MGPTDNNSSSDDNTNTAVDEAQRSLTYGEKAVGLTFNPSNNAIVQEIKERFAGIIDKCNTERSLTEDPEVIRMYAIAIHEAQSAQMWAVKAATWESN